MTSMIFVDRLTNGVAMYPKPIVCERVGRRHVAARVAELEKKYDGPQYRISVLNFSEKSGA